MLGLSCPSHKTSLHQSACVWIHTCAFHSQHFWLGGACLGFPGWANGCRLWLAAPRYSCVCRKQLLGWKDKTEAEKREPILWFLKWSFLISLIEFHLFLVSLTSFIFLAIFFQITWWPCEPQTEKLPQDIVGIYATLSVYLWKNNRKLVQNKTTFMCAKNIHIN